jgi:hypothetical protein
MGVIGSDDLLDPADLDSRKSTTSLQPDWVEPEFCHLILTFYMHMRRFIAISGVKEEPKWSNSQNRWH